MTSDITDIIAATIPQFREISGIGRSKNLYTARRRRAGRCPSDMIINGCKLMVGANAKHWIALPAQPQTGRDHFAKLTPARSPSGRG
jgi:hypothetical protein